MKVLRRLLCLLTLVIGAPSLAAAKFDFWQMKSRVDALIDEGKCDDAWALLWSRAQRGDVDAQAYMSTAIISGVMAPRFLNEENVINYVTLMTLYSTRSDKDVSLSSAKELLMSSQPSARREFLIECFGQRQQDVKCVDEAIARKIMPSFDVFAREADELGVPGSACLMDGRRRPD